MMRVGMAVAMVMAGTGLAHGQRHNDFTQMSNYFSPDQSSARFGQPWNAKMPEVNESVGGRRVTMGQYNVTYSSLNGKTGPVDPRLSAPQSNQNYALKMTNLGDTRQPDMSRLNGLQSSVSDSTNYNNWQRPATGPSKFTDALTVHTGQNNAPPQDFGQPLSMQDINRFEFRSSRSSEGGLTVTHAASGASSSSGGLSDSPALFDFGSNNRTLQPATSTVRSGSTVAPTVRTSDGSTQQMAPTRRNTLPTSGVVVASPETATTALPSGTVVIPAGQAAAPTAEALQPRRADQYARPKNGVNTEVQYGETTVSVRIKD
jgi:hypothetical protein